ncbi:protein ASPARTIC PROTEASE IN GUARD CELL 1-like [Populus alba x Populus x berolinensis]|uniref:Protein ASPARTIC PROTEASE IN GUARD CELL 1-like n=1 Tax=Populus alba x Populus x berolinensis TaxID=444605 RepID=A0AAD6MB50_9ROSI|nr:protein ASPARTIC PROTEASE IN GUARD CELL 1-like [Populus alba x Populus x berolinensis]
MGLLFYVIFSLFFASPPVSSSRILTPQPSETTVLDVAASIQGTKNIFSSGPKISPFNQQEKETTSSELTVELLSRTSIQKTTHTDYKSLTLSRLERDSSRVKSLVTRLDLAINSISSADLKPLETDSEFKSEDLQSPIISGTSQGSGEYFSRVGIGKPPSQAYLILDTGSDQADPIFEPASSASFSTLSCNTRQCRSLDVSECRNDTCLYEVSYGDGSYTVGDFVTETITLGSAPVDNVAIGCGHNNEGLFVGAAGLLGLGGGSLSFPSQIKATSFSYCLVDRDSESASTLEFNSTLRGELVSIPESAFQIDESGNGGLQTDVYNSLRDAFVKRTRDLPSTNGMALFDTCYNLSSKGNVEVPTVSFHFPDGEKLLGSARLGRNVLFCICTNGIVFVNYWERAAAGDTCRL